MIKYIFLIIIAFSSLTAIPFTENLMVNGHSVYLTKSAGETQEWKIRLIQEAKLSLEISAGYCMGTVFEELLDAIGIKLQTNSQIRVYLMGVQMAGCPFTASNHKKIANLLDQFPDRFSFLMTEDSELTNQENKVYISENHTKLMIVDEKYLLLGGTNLADCFSTADISKYPVSDTAAGKLMQLAACDMDVIISGPIAQKIRHEYFKLFAFFETGQKLEVFHGEYNPEPTYYLSVENEGRAHIVCFEDNPETARNASVFGAISGPRFGQHTIGNMYEYIIDQAAASIDIGNMYFFPRESIYNALLNAVNRDVAVTLVTNGPHDDFIATNSLRFFYGYMNRKNYFPLMCGAHFSIWDCFKGKEAEKKSTQVFELNISGVLLHKKVMTVDHLYSIIGSYNLGMKSEDAAFEVAVIIESPEIAMQLKNVLIKDQIFSTPISFNQALGWYFDPYYLILNELERKFFDGIIL